MKKSRQKIIDFLEEETGGKSYKAHKYSLDADDRPRVEYGSEDKDNVWKEIKETVRHTKYVDLGNLAQKIATQKNNPLAYFKVSLNVVVPSNYTFEGLHRIIMECTNWEGYHLYSFEFSQYLEHIVEIPDEDDFPLEERNFKKTHDPRTTILSKLFEYDKECIYNYDYGDDWHCRVKVVRTFDAGEAQPEVLKFSGKWPPEDCGSLGGFEDLQRALKKKENKEKLAEDEQDLIDWVAGMKFKDFDIKKINAKLAKLPKGLRK